MAFFSFVLCHVLALSLLVLCIPVHTYVMNTSLGSCFTLVIFTVLTLVCFVTKWVLCQVGTFIARKPQDPRIVKNSSVKEP